ISGTILGDGNLQGSQYAADVLATADLTAYYRFEEAAGSSVAVDSSPSGFDGVLENGVEAGLESASAFPALGSAINFDGVNDTIALVTASELGFQNGSFTAMAWVNPTALTGDNT